MATVLVVDDDDAIRESARFILEDAGYAVMEASDGDVALDALRASAEPVVVLLDILMPRVSGVEVLREALSDERLRRHAYIAWPATPARIPPELLDALGARLLRKPFDLDVLVSAVAGAAARLDARATD